MKILAISDLHIGYAENLRALERITPRRDDWLLLAGDVGETCEHLALAFDILVPRFRQLVWVPGNHELWTIPGRDADARGVEKYERLLDACRRYGVLTPESPYPVVDVEGRAVRIVPLFLLYDHSFRPPEVPRHDAVAWAQRAGVVCADEHLLHADPHASVTHWCDARCALTQARLRGCTADVPNLLVNHYPLRHDLITLPGMPRFSIWCGTARTEDWHLRYGAAAVVSGHLHVPRTQWRDGVRFEEVSLGYPRQWRIRGGIDACVREILPGPRRGAVPARS